MQLVVSTGKYKLNTISLYKHSAIILAEVCTSPKSTNKIGASKAITKIHRFQPNMSFLLHITI